MTTHKPVAMITPPNTLRSKVGSPLPALDQDAIARAEAALDKLSEKFADWIEEELGRLTEAWATFVATPADEACEFELHRRAHDLKGLATTYGYPLVGRMSATLCRLTGDEHGDIAAPVHLLKAHVDAIRAAIAGKVMGTDHPVGLALAAELEEHTRSVIAAQSNATKA